MRVASAVGAHATEVVFTSGGSEANNLFLKGAAGVFKPALLAISAIEHPCVREPARRHADPQSFGRHVRTLLGMTAGEFRARFTGETLLERLLADLVRPHREALRALQPLALRPGMRRLAPSLRDRRPAFHQRHD